MVNYGKPPEVRKAKINRRRGSYQASTIKNPSNFLLFAALVALLYDRL